MSDRSQVRKTYKNYVNGAFARSESGRHVSATDHAGSHLANVPRSSRKDLRDAVQAARVASAAWARRTAYNRGQVLYRCAEALESRCDELSRSAVAQRGLSEPEAYAETSAAVDTLVHYAGWTDKLASVLGSINPVAAPYHSFTTIEATGVVAVLAPDLPDLGPLVRDIAAALSSGNVVVALISERWPLRALDLGEVLGVSDIPQGVVNLLSGNRDELVSPLCGHRDVNAIVDSTGLPDLRERIDALAAETVKRIIRLSGGALTSDALTRLESLSEPKTAWHPVGV